MPIALYIFTLTLLIGLELGTLPFLPPFLRAVSPVTVFLTLCAMQPGNRRTWISAAAVGLSFDMVSIFPLGTYTLAYMALTGLIVYMTHRFLTHHSFWSRLIAVMMASVFMGSTLAMARAVSWYTLHSALYQITVSQTLWYILISTASNSALVVAIVLIRPLLQRKSPFQKWNGRRRFTHAA